VLVKTQEVFLPPKRMCERPIMDGESGESIEVPVRNITVIGYGYTVE